MSCPEIALQKIVIKKLKSKVMVEKKIYAQEFQRMVAKSYFNTSQSMASIGKQFNVPPATVCFWIGKYKDEFSKEKANIQNVITFKAAKRNHTAMKKKKLTPEEMEKRILELEQRLKDEQMRSIMLDKMIEIAERDLQISIRKKSGAK